MSGPLDHPLLAALLRAPLAWQTPAELARSLAMAIDDVCDQIADLEVDGSVDVSDADTGVVVAFSFRSINELNLELIDDARTGLPRWALRRPTVKSHQVASDPPDLNLCVDTRSLSPDRSAELMELWHAQAERVRRRKERRGLPLRYEDVPFPTVVYTGPAWPPWYESGHQRKHEVHCSECYRGGKRRKVLSIACRCGRGVRSAERPGRCPACPDRPLERSEYCLRCKRWGWDAYFHPEPKSDSKSTEGPQPA